MSRTRPVTLATVAGLALVGALAGCGSASNATSAPASSDTRPTSSAPAAPTPLAVTVDAKGGLTGLPTTLTTGTYDITATPADAKADYTMQIFRLSPGYTQAMLLADVGSGFMADKPDLAAVVRLYSRASFVGGPSGTGIQRAITYLPPGDYGYANVSVEGKPVVTDFTVTGAATAPVLPSTPVTVSASGDGAGAYTWNVDGSLGASGVLTFKNSSQDNAHFLFIIKAKPGRTAAECEAYQGDPSDPASPCTPVVDTGIVSGGAAEVISYTAQGPGTYLLMCYLPDPKTGQPHAMEGMSKQVTVS